MLLHSKILGDSATEVLILHGFLGSGDNWLSVARALCKKNIKVHLIDQRNHGRSFHSDEFNYVLMCGDLYNYINYYKIINLKLTKYVWPDDDLIEFNSLPFLFGNK